MERGRGHPGRAAPRLSVTGVQFHPESVLTTEGKKLLATFLDRLTLLSDAFTAQGWVGATVPGGPWSAALWSVGALPPVSHYDRSRFDTLTCPRRLVYHPPVETGVVHRPGACFGVAQVRYRRAAPELLQGEPDRSGTSTGSEPGGEEHDHCVARLTVDPAERLGSDHLTLGYIGARRFVADIGLSPGAPSSARTWSSVKPR